MAVERVVVFRPGALGDTLLSVGALAGLRQAFPGAVIELVGHGEAAALLRQAGLVDAASTFDSLQVAGLFLSAPLVSQRWHGARLVVLWLRGAGAIARAFEAAGAQQVIAADPAGGGPSVHVADHLIATLAPAGVLAPSSWPHFEPGRGGNGAQGPGRAVIHPGSGSPSKNWSPRSFATMLRAMTVWGLDPLLVAGPADEAAVAQVLREVPERNVEVVRPANVKGLVGVLAQATLYVGNDSGVSHLAALLGVPSVAVFGATDPARWAPRGERVCVVGRAGGWPPEDQVLASAATLLRRPSASLAEPG